MLRIANFGMNFSNLHAAIDDSRKGFSCTALKLKNSLIACFCLLALIGLIAAITPVTSQGQGQGGPPTQNVNVVNTPIVNVANTPTVNAQQSGAWSVDIVQINHEFRDELRHIRKTNGEQI